MRNIFRTLGAALLQGALLGSIGMAAPQSREPEAQVSNPPLKATAKPAVASHGTAKLSFEKQVAPLLTKYCAGCHRGKSAPNDVRLDFGTEADARKIATSDNGFWSRVSTELSTKQMPPPFAKIKPTNDERALLVGWIDGNALAANTKPDPGPYMVRRLNNRQYANTLRDLLFLPDDYNAAADFPPDERGDGFDNNAGTLTISPLLIESYLAAVEKATVTALGLDPKAAPQGRDATLAAKNKLNEPSAALRVDFADRQEKIRLNMETFAPRAFRRPTSKEEIDGLMKFAALSFAHAGESFDQATALSIRAALMSPEFLFRIERDPHSDGTGKVFEITEYQLATRLSYFLWNTMPDVDLYVAARDNKLRATLDEQLVRMLKSPKSISLTKDFLGQWLEIRGMREVTNTPKSLLESMQSETEHFFDYIVKNDRSIMEFLDADYTFVNEELAKLYGMSGITGEEFQKVEVDRAQRGGIFTQASFLTLTAKPLGDSRRTSPVLRGKWILENIFNQPVPPPPPNVPELKLDTNKELKGTVRQIFEQHRADPACAGCHARMDPYGFALENYDGYGAWRKQDNHVDVDPSGEVNGKRFKTPVEFRALLAMRKDDFRCAVVSKLLSYALGRGIQSYDRPAIDQICANVQAEGDRFSSLIANIVKSYPFQYAHGMKGDIGEETSASTWFPPVSDKPVPIPLPDPPRRGGRGGNRTNGGTLPAAGGNPGSNAVGPQPAASSVTSTSTSGAETGPKPVVPATNPTPATAGTSKKQ